MEPISILCVLIGMLIMLLRAPLIFAPIATLDLFEGLITSNTKIRVLGFVIGAPALGLIAFADGSGGVGGANALKGLLLAVGWLLAGVTVVLLLAPGLYRSFAASILAAMRRSVDTAFIRALGVIGVSIGAALVYAGLFVL